MEEITVRWSSHSLSGTKGDGFWIGDEMGSNEFIFASKFYTKRVLNTEAIARNFTHLWRLRNGFKIKDVGDHIVLFIFDSKLEADRVVDSQPWSFDKHLLAIQRYEKQMPIRELCFDHIPFWVQVYDIPIKFINRSVSEGICLGIGEVYTIENSAMEGGDFMRIRVIIDISKPLCQGRRISMDDGSNG
ncbi:uncharacterized protein LOC115986035 [Quercus lobata]|uniref:uncharacterized protein LOC115986035 n=1 Tax=Quercus lobata TaxID=97700 RepID=UPI001248840F|nr:uncharacterized protein LOC115986035 [Quercus lobata]